MTAARATGPRTTGASLQGIARSSKQVKSYWSCLQMITFSSTSGSMLPMKRLAPTSRVFLSWLALFTRIGLPYTLIMFSTLMACTVYSHENAGFRM